MDTAPLRILYMIDEMQALTAGGTERQLLQMIDLMKQSGADVRLCTLRGTEWLTPAIAGCPVEHFNLTSLTSLSGVAEMRRIYRWIKANNVQVLQTFFVEANIIGPLLGKMARVPILLGSRRNLNYWMSPRLAAMQRMANKFSTRLVANCEAVKSYVVKTEGVTADKVDVLYNGLDLEHFETSPLLRQQARATSKYADSDIVIGCVSALRPIKGCETFIDAAHQVTKRVPQARFVLVGDGPLRSELEARTSDISARFLFAGAQDDVRPWLNVFDIGVLASESEGFSNSILEYLAASLPCVVSDVGGNAEAIDTAGLVVRPKDAAALAEALVALVTNPAARADYSRKAQARASAFDLKSTQANLVSYYGRLAGR
jgi:glycosyltransferase involved in cell wall biosynthesis